MFLEYCDAANAASGSRYLLSILIISILVKWEGDKGEFDEEQQ